jgi:hypothetical protein
VSFKYPVYSIVTVSPLLGITPVPSRRIVLVTPMIADVRVKVRCAVGSAALKEIRDVRCKIRSCGVRENMWRG